MFEIVISALLAGQLITATHEFGEREACLRTGVAVWHQLKDAGAQEIHIRCYEEPAT